LRSRRTLVDSGNARRPGRSAMLADDRGDRLLRRQRNPCQCCKTLEGLGGSRHGSPHARSAKAGNRGRRRRWRRRDCGLGALRAGRPRRRRRRLDPDRQPARRPDPDHCGVAMRVVIAEDSVLLREGLSRLLAESGFDVVAAVPDGETALRAVEEHRPDVVVFDVRMPPTFTDEGLRAALVVRSQWPDVAVLVFSQYVEERYATELLAGETRGVGYLLKDRVADVVEFVAALRRVAEGGTVLDPEVVAQLLARSRRTHPLDKLTARER